MPETISLNSSQREKAISILRALSEDKVTTPKDILDEWCSPQSSVRWEQRDKDETFPQYERYIDPSDIRGTTGSVDWIHHGRLAKKLKLMLDGDYNLHRGLPPALQKRGEWYYVTSDGHHRCMAAKAVGLDELYVGYEEVPPELLEESCSDSPA